MLMLHSFGEPTAEIGARNWVNITVEANDDPYGLITFAAGLVIYASESELGGHQERQRF